VAVRMKTLLQPTQWEKKRNSGGSMNQDISIKFQDFCVQEMETDGNPTKHTFPTTNATCKRVQTWLEKS